MKTMTRFIVYAIKRKMAQSGDNLWYVVYVVQVSVTGVKVQDPPGDQAPGAGQVREFVVDHPSWSVSPHTHARAGHFAYFAHLRARAGQGWARLGAGMRTWSGEIAPVPTHITSLSIAFFRIPTLSRLPSPPSPPFPPYPRRPTLNTALRQPDNPSLGNEF